MNESHAVTTIEELEALYGEAPKRALVKELDHISDHYRAFIEASPFVVLASVSEDGLDCSPRGDPPGFVRVTDANTVLIPDRRGNNRIDTLRNIVRDPRVSLLFLIPGIGETLRINGRAQIIRDPALCDTFAINGKAPVTVLSVTAERVYFQCQKALVRSRLWAQETQIPRSALPSTGEMLEALDAAFDGKGYDAGYSEHLARTIY